jgi:predicted amidohydrolase
MERELIVATCQFPVSGDVKRNTSYVLKQLTLAKSKGAEIAHFSESSLSGYAGVDFESHARQDEVVLHSALEQVRQLARELEIWVVLGGHHFELSGEPPVNCLWLINKKGKLVDRYDKRFLFGEPGEKERHFYSPGSRAVQFQIKGITCGLLICHEWRYPELYREQMLLGTEILFQSWYDGNMGAEEYETDGRDLGTLIVGTVRGNAANNALWISASNTSKRESSFASFVVRPDGRVYQRLRRNVTGVLISEINVDRPFSDPSGPWRRTAVECFRSADVGQA